jgi:hypothetical protein
LKGERSMLLTPEPMSLRTRWLYDIAKLAFLALVFVPVYLLVNQFWQSVFRLLALYGLLTLFCFRLGEYMHRAIRRLPAEIPPWHGAPAITHPPSWMDQRFGASEAIRSARHDPQYVQLVLKPRLRRLLVYRLNGNADMPLEALDNTQLARIEPALLDFLRRQEPMGVWARFRYRRQRSYDVLNALRQIEAL